MTVKGSLQERLVYTEQTIFLNEHLV